MQWNKCAAFMKWKVPLQCWWTFKPDLIIFHCPTDTQQHHNSSYKAPSFFNVHTIKDNIFYRTYLNVSLPTFWPTVDNNKRTSCRGRLFTIKCLSLQELISFHADPFHHKHNQPSLIHLICEHSQRYSHWKPYTLCRGCAQQSPAWLIRRRALGHSPLLHVWAGSSVTLTEELLKPKWAVRSVLQDKGQVTLWLTPHCSLLLISYYVL